MMNSAKTLDELYNQYDQDIAFNRLKTHATQIVKGEGPLDALIAFVGEAPGKYEDEQGKPFVGPAGRVFDSLLASIEVARTDVFVTNVVKFRPKGNRPGKENREPTWGEVEASKKYIEHELSLLETKIICPMGRHALSLFFPEHKLSVKHGIKIVKDDLIYVPLYHPAVALYNPDMESVLFEDFNRLGVILDATH